MAFNRQSNSNSKVIMGTLGGLVGLVLALWVFDQVLDVVVPLLYTCINGTYYNTTACCLTGASDCAIGTINGSTPILGYFGTTTTFIQNILPVVGIIASYMMIKGALKRMSL